MAASNPPVQLLATGGTIANPPEIEGYLSGDDLVDAIPELAEVASMRVREVASKPSSRFVVQDWVDLSRAVEEVCADDEPAGIVVTQGSNTTEETAYYLHLTLDTTVPVAVTAAQRNFGTIGNDGNRNLLDAVRTVVHPDAPGRGAFVVLNDQIHAARDVTKAVSGRPDAWTSCDFGPIGLVDKSGLVQFYFTPDRPHTVDTPFEAPASADEFPEVEIVFSAVDIGGGAVRDAVDRGVDGIVLAAYPTGSPARAEVDGQGEALEAAAEEVPVVISHRGLEGWPGQLTRDAEQFIWGDTLTPQKARILLGLGLLQTDDRAALQSYFETF